jgi:radical SAM superfamily enzyme YgiQ (UPF0313 family)
MGREEMKTVIVKTNNKKNQYGPLKDISAIEPPIWHAILANYYKADNIVDAEALDYDVAETFEAIVQCNPERVVILSTGSHPSAFIQQKQNMNELVRLLKGYHVTCLDKLPVSPVKWGSPRWDLLPMEKYRSHNWHSWTNDCITQPYGTLYTSVSCPFHCEFCTIHQFYGKLFEQRLLEDIYKDLDYFAKNNVKNIKLMDELFIFNQKKVFSICDYIIANGYDFNIWAYARIDIMNPQLLEKLKKAGINWLAYGIETGNDDIRKNVLKGKFDNNRIRDVIRMTKHAGVASVGNYMFGFWEDNMRTMQETLNFALELQCEYSNLYCVTAYPNSPLYRKMEKLGVDLPKSWEEYAQFSKKFKPLSTQHIDGQQVREFRQKAFDTIFNDIHYLDMMEKQYGKKIVDDIKKMTSIKVR